MSAVIVVERARPAALALWGYLAADAIARRARRAPNQPNRNQ